MPSCELPCSGSCAHAMQVYSDGKDAARMVKAFAGRGLLDEVRCCAPALCPTTVGFSL